MPLGLGYTTMKERKRERKIEIDREKHWKYQEKKLRTQIAQKEYISTICWKK